MLTVTLSKVVVVSRSTGVSIPFSAQLRTHFRLSKFPYHPTSSLPAPRIQAKRTAPASSQSSASGGELAGVQEVPSLY